MNLPLYSHRKTEPDPLNQKLGRGEKYQCGRSGKAQKKKVVLKGAENVGYFYRLEQVQSEDKG